MGVGNGGVNEEGGRGNIIRLVGQIKDTKEGKAIGYVVLDIPSNEIKLFNIEETIELIKLYKCENAVYTDGKLEGTQASLNRLPVYNRNKQIIDNPRVTILSNLYKNDKSIGFNLMDAYGRRATVDIETTIKLIQKHEATNAKLVTRDGRTIVSAIYGEFPITAVEEKRRRTEGEVDNGQERYVRDYSDGRYIKNLKILKYANTTRLHLEDFRDMDGDIVRKTTTEAMELDISRQYEDITVKINHKYQYLNYHNRNNIIRMRLTDKVGKNKIGPRDLKHYPNTIREIKLYGTINGLRRTMLKDMTVYGIINLLEEQDENEKYDTLLRYILKIIKGTWGLHTLYIFAMFVDYVRIKRLEENRGEGRFDLDHFRPGNTPVQIGANILYVYHTTPLGEANERNKHEKLIVENIAKYATEEGAVYLDTGKGIRVRDDQRIITKLNCGGYTIEVIDSNIVLYNRDKTISHHISIYSEARGINRKIHGLLEITDGVYQVINAEYGYDVDTGETIEVDEKGRIRHYYYPLETRRYQVKYGGMEEEIGRKMKKYDNVNELTDLPNFYSGFLKERREVPLELLKKAGGGVNKEWKHY